MLNRAIFGALGSAVLILSVTAESRIQPKQDDFKLRHTVSLLERILLESNSIPIDTYTFVATNESFFWDVIDRLAWHCNTLMLPVFNNAQSLNVHSKQLIVLGADDVDSIMLDEGKIDIFIDKNFRADWQSVSHVLPEMNGVCLVIPKTKKYELLQHLLTPLLSAAWIVLIIALLVGSFVANRYFKNGLLATLIFGVNLNAPGVSRTERTVLFASLLVFFILSEAYQAKLVSLISSCRYPPDPKTVDEFLQTDVMLYVGEATATFVSYRPMLKGRVRNATNYWFSFDGEQDYGTLMQCPAAWDIYVRWINKRYDRYGYNIRPRVHIVREHILSMPASYTFSRSFLLYPRFKVYLTRIFESGLMGYWQTEQDRQRLFEQKLEFVENEIISFSDLEMVWTVLGIGNTAALAVFLLEVAGFALQKYIGTYWPTGGQRLFVKSKKHQKLLPGGGVDFD
uniref:Ionotropic glutamate receptor C-terminal domain-containing protein n=1 Tax=Anopheles stephensi TaxID=30069 RepID=A0A182XZJ8_ANOST